jgi:drug/metabolite transporter (DMT)-like permease
MQPLILNCEKIFPENCSDRFFVILDRSLAAALATMLAWGVNFAFVKYVLDHLGVGAFMFLRFSILTLLGFVLLVIVFRSRVAHTWPRREDLPRFVACGLIGHALHIAVVMYGMSLSTAFSSSLVLTSGPLFTLMILTLLGAERLRLRQVAGTLVAFGGIVLFLADKFVAGFARGRGRPHPARCRVPFLPLHGSGAAARPALRAADRALLHASLFRAADPGLYIEFIP